MSESNGRRVRIVLEGGSVIVAGGVAVAAYLDDTPWYFAFFLFLVGAYSLTRLLGPKGGER